MERRPFVVQYHEKTPDDKHYDFMLEREGKLATWSLPLPPQAGRKLEGKRLFDHRLKYLTFEGDIGRGLGKVTIWWKGHYEALCWTDHLVEGRLWGEEEKGEPLTFRLIRCTENLWWCEFWQE